MKLTKLIQELQQMYYKHGDVDVVVLDGCEEVTGVIWSEMSEELLGADAPVYLSVQS